MGRLTFESHARAAKSESGGVESGEETPRKWGGNEKFAEIRAGSLPRLAASPLDSALAATLLALLLQREPARRLGIQ